MTMGIAWNRRRYAQFWELVASATEREEVVLDNFGSKYEANKIRNALQAMARYRGIVLLSSIEVATSPNGTPEVGKWRIRMVRM